MVCLGVKGKGEEKSVLKKEKIEVERMKNFDGVSFFNSIILL